MVDNDYYTDIQYSEHLPENAKQDLNLLFFKSFLKDSQKILDIGCSKGRFIEIDPQRIEGIDMDKKALEICKKKGFRVKYCDISKGLPFKNESFDAVFFSQVIEHLEDPLFVMKEIHRILKKGGRLVVVTIDYKITHHKGENGFWSDYTHKTPFIKESLDRIAYNAGFDKHRVYHFPGKGFRNLMRKGKLSKEKWINIQKSSLVWRGQDLILEAIKD